MPVKINSYINFDGNAKQAMDFYQSVFGGEVISDTFSSYESEAMPVVEIDRDKIMHASLKGDHGIELMAADIPTGSPVPKDSKVWLTLNGDDEELLRGYWLKLMEGGEVLMPLEKAPWGDMFGMLVDRFGISWMIDIGPAQ